MAIADELNELKQTKASIKEKLMIVQKTGLKLQKKK